jgi:hypothetical protein
MSKSTKKTTENYLPFLQALPPGVVTLAHWILGTYNYSITCCLNVVFLKLRFEIRKEQQHF